MDITEEKEKKTGLKMKGGKTYRSPANLLETVIWITISKYKRKYLQEQVPNHQLRSASDGCRHKSSLTFFLKGPTKGKA
jgi:hypothetical protein